MSRLAVRTAVKTFLEEADLQYVGKVHAARPQIVSEQDYERNRMGEAIPSESGSSAVLVVGIPSDDRMRRADTGRGAVNDTQIHKIALEIFFASTGGKAVKAQEDYDVVVDGIVSLIRSNAILNAPGVIWSAGEYQAGIQHQQGLPYTDGGLTVFIFGVVHFEAWEWIAGPVK